MPKMKTNPGAKRDFLLTGTGKIRGNMRLKAIS